MAKLPIIVQRWAQSDNPVSEPTVSIGNTLIYFVSSSRVLGNNGVEITSSNTSYTKLSSISVTSVTIPEQGIQARASIFYKIADGNDDTTFAYDNGDDGQMNIWLVEIKGETQNPSWTSFTRNNEGDRIILPGLNTNVNNTLFLAFTQVRTGNNLSPTLTTDDPYPNLNKGDVNLSGVHKLSWITLSGASSVPQVLGVDSISYDGIQVTYVIGVAPIPTKITIGVDNSLVATVDGDDNNPNLIIKK